MLLRKQIILGSIGDFPLTGTAVVLIRVTIELRLWNMYGLEAITDRYGRSLKVPVELLLAYTKQNFNKLVFPVKYSQLEKIFKWTNYSIHGGLAPYVWQIEFAHHLISALYVSGEHNGVRYAFGAVKVPRHVYDGIEPFIWFEYNPRREKGISRLAWIYRLLARIGARKIQPRSDIRIIRLENPESIII